MPLAWPKLACFQGVDSPRGRQVTKREKQSTTSHLHLFLRKAENFPQSIKASETRSSVSSFLELGPFFRINSFSFLGQFHLLVFFQTTFDFQKLKSLNLKLAAWSFIIHKRWNRRLSNFWEPGRAQVKTFPEHGNVYESYPNLWDWQTWTRQLPRFSWLQSAFVSCLDASRYIFMVQ